MSAPVVLITGALTGIGRVTALAFASEGRADVRHEDDVRALVEKTVERFGRLDVAVNNAGTEGKTWRLWSIRLILASPASFRSCRP